MEVMHTDMEMRIEGMVKRQSEKSEQEGTRTRSCAPARSRTLSVLNLRPSERYASAAFSSIPISLRRNDSRLPSLITRRKKKEKSTRSVWHKSVVVTCCNVYLPFNVPKSCIRLLSLGVSGCPSHRLFKKGIPGILHRLRLYIFES
jgi:hypothetical protein